MSTQAEGNWERIGELFEAALEVPRAVRAQWLLNACPDDARVREEVRRMLAAHEKVGVLDASLDSTVLESREPVPDERVGPYRLIREIGRGGMGVVYQAHDSRLDRFVALKFLPERFSAQESAKARLFDEARAASALDHPNICTVYDIGEAADGRLYIAIAYYEGQTLAARLEGGPVSPQEALDIAIQVARGLAIAHEAGIVHRDLKPSNLMITRRSVVKILDFGVAKIERAHAATGTHVGTPPYMSPEQARGAETDHRADLWSLGVVLYEMLSGRRPFAGRHEGEVLEAVLHREPVPLRTLRPDAPAALEGAVRRLLSKSAADRYASATELLGDLEEARRSVGLPRAAEMAACGALPLSVTSFVGRENEVQRLLDLLSTVRLVTLTGPAGTGKTRLSLETANRLASRVPDGICFVPLATITNPHLVVPTIAQALGLTSSGAPLAPALRTAIAHRAMLLVLDNFEQVAAAAPVLAELLEACPRLTLLVTSRVALRLSAEHEFRVPPLELPSHPGDLDALGRTPAVQLFVERATAVRGDFAVTPANAEAVAELCVRLDGLPLAIELAAARIKILSPQAMLARLGARLDLLKGGPRDRPARHQTLRQALAWSYDLLGEPERKLFRRAGVFVGGFSLEAIETVAPAFGDLDVDLIDGLSSLVDHSLISQREDAQGEPRFHLLETVREYAFERLKEANEEQLAARARADWALDFCERAEPELTGTAQAGWLDRLEAEHDNIRAALSWLEERGEIAPALRIGAAIWRFWTARGHMREGRARLERLLAAPSSGVSPDLRAYALNGCGTLAHGCCDLTGARALLEQSLALFRQGANRSGIALALNNIAWVYIEKGELSDARRCAEEAYALHRDLDEKRGMAVALNNLGWIANYQSDYEAADSFHSQGLALRREIGDFRGVAFALSNLAWVEQNRGEHDRAVRLLDEAFQALHEVKDRMLLAWARQIRAAVAYDAGDFEKARAILDEGLPTWRQSGNSSGLMSGLYYFGLTLIRLGHLEHAAEAFDEAANAVGAEQQRWGSAIISLGKARLAQARGRPQEALSLFETGLAFLRELGDRRGMAEAIEGMAEVLEKTDPERAVGLLSAADALRAASNAPLPRFLRPLHESRLLALRAAVGDERFEQIWAHASA